MRSLRRACVALVAAAALSACLAPQPVVRPSESPAPTATPSPTPIPTFTLLPETPTLAPTVAPPPPTAPPRTARPAPTNHDAGDKLIPYYFVIRGQFSIFPPTPVGQPIFTVREDFIMTPRTAYHEIGHAYEALLQRKDASVDWRAKYWAFRGFPGTWQQAAAEAATMTGMGQWIHQPQESWAEAFSVSIVGGGQEKTLDYGRTINPVATKAFFMSLLNGAG